MKTISKTDITIGAKFKLSNGTIFTIDDVKDNLVYSSIEGGTKGNYCNDIYDTVNFFNEEKAIKLT